MRKEIYSIIMSIWKTAEILDMKIRGKSTTEQKWRK